MNETLEEMTKNYNGLKRVHDSANKTLEYFDVENKRLNTVISLLLQEKAQWTQSKETWNQIMTKTILDNNLKIKEVNDEIQKLKDENNTLKDELKKYKAD